MAKVLLTIIVNCRLHFSVSGSLIAKDWTRFTSMFVLQFVDHVIAIQKG